MKCLFRHDWIYSERRYVNHQKCQRHIYGKRVCHRCGRIEENNGFIDSSFGLFVWTNKWMGVGYNKEPSQLTEGDSK